MRILKAKQVAEKTSISIPHINRMAREGEFPKSIKISESRQGWLEEDIDNWIMEKVEAHRREQS